MINRLRAALAIIFLCGPLLAHASSVEAKARIAREKLVINHDIHVNQPAHVFAYIGHNGLMDFTLPKTRRKKISLPSSAIILACKSDSYFESLLKENKTHKLLTTSGFMAPEAYTLEAALSSWLSGGTTEDVHSAAASTYARFQKAKLSWSKHLFEYD